MVTVVQGRLQLVAHMQVVDGNQAQAPVVLHTRKLYNSYDATHHHRVTRE